MIVPEGWPFILVPACLGLGLAILGWIWAGWVVIGVGLVCLFVFRDPPRSFTAPPGVACAPADGRVERLELVEEGEQSRLRLGIRIPPFAPQVTRLPLDAELVEVVRRDAPIDAPREVLESSWRTRCGPMALRQVAGRFAHRVVFDKLPGATVERGARIGMIRFGARVEVDLPGPLTALVRVGDRVRAGGTPIARSAAPEVT